MSYTVAVIGGACAGSEITACLADLGLEVVVFEQNPLPYGKIEDGLPRWHNKQQAREYANIDEKLNRPQVHYVPNCKLGKDLAVASLVSEWQFPLVIMANGAWKDRPLRVDGVDRVEDDSLVYQNEFVYWFNHYEDADYSGKTYTVPPGAMVIGGGLASIDMAKVFQFEMVKNALAERGLKADMLDLEHRGIPYTLEKLGLTWEELGLQPSKLFYRKRVADMPLVPLGDTPSEAKLIKACSTREKLVANACRKFLFEVHPLRSPCQIHTQDGRVTGVTFKVMEHQDGSFVATGETERVDTTFLVSSIGSTPEPIEGVPMSGELYRWVDYFTGAVDGLDRFYCVGNAITGRGNIKDSAKNARRLGAVIGSGIKGEEPDYGALFRAQEELARKHVSVLLEFLAKEPPTPENVTQGIRHKVKAYHESIGYTDYNSWRDSTLKART